jgi:tetratricopeptide (TPR) repeat protein
MEGETQNKKSDWIQKLYPFLVSLSTATVMLLAFFIPSIQDQWDRWESRKVIEEYVHLGDHLFDQERYQMAEEAYTKAFELSESKRLDIEVKRLNARVNRVHDDPSFIGQLPEDLKEIDFRFLLHFQEGKGHEHSRAYTLNCYGMFLSNKGKLKEANAAFDEAIQLFAEEPISYVNKGNLFMQWGKNAEAEKMYRHALELDSANIYAHYNLSLLLSETGRKEEADSELKKANDLEHGMIDK